MALFDRDQTNERSRRFESHQSLTLEVLEREISEWTDWMKGYLPLAGFDVPSEETCVSFAAESAHLVEQVRRISRHFPKSLRTALMEASILHQCWKRQVKQRKRNKQLASEANRSPIPRLDAVSILQKHSSNTYTLECTDGLRYRVKAPCPGTEMIRATRVIGMEMAREVGLPVAPAKLIFLDRAVALTAGIRRDCRKACWSTEIFCPSGDKLCCLGVREFERLDSAEGALNLPLSRKAFRYLVGKTVFDLWVLNWISEPPVFWNVAGRAEPLFNEFGHCLMDSDWERFRHAKNREPLPKIERTVRIRSHQQLEPWIRRIEEVNLNVIWEIVNKLPSFWYCCRPALVSAVIGKLEERQRELRSIVQQAIKSGYFPAISKGVERQEISVGTAPLCDTVCNVRQFRTTHK